MWWRGIPGEWEERTFQPMKRRYCPIFFISKIQKNIVILKIRNGKWNSVNLTNYRFSFLNLTKVLCHCRQFIYRIDVKF
jgi:hypothetical protein